MCIGKAEKNFRSKQTVPELPTAQFLENFFGMSDMVLQKEAGGSLTNIPVEKSVRRLSDILPAASGNVFLWKRPMILDWLRSGTNPILYEAYRSLLPPRYSADISPCADREALMDMRLQWHIDLVIYRSGVFPSGELYRSIGHWNTLDEWELFQVCSGQVVMIYADQRPEGTWAIEIVLCKAGDGLLLKPGAWHITYPLVDHSSVVNIYSSPLAASSGAIGSPAKKYELRSHNNPELAILQTDGEIQAVWRNGKLEQKAPFRSPSGIPFLQGETEYPWLSQWFGLASQADLERDLALLQDHSINVV